MAAASGAAGVRATKGGGHALENDHPRCEHGGGLCGSGVTFGAADEPAVTSEQRQVVQVHKQSDQAKLGGGLAAIASQAAAPAARQRAALPASAALAHLEKLMGIADGYVMIDVYARGSADGLMTELVSKGMLGAQVYGPVVSGRVPLAAIGDIAASVNVVRVLPRLARASAGAVTSQGDIAQRSDEARKKARVDGRYRSRGIRVGVLSDSYNCATEPFAPGAPFSTAEDDQETGDVPKDVIVLDDVSGCEGGTDEGRAMMQIVHDVAPGASGAFASAFSGQAGFANAILALKDVAGSEVIVDDVIYFAEPMFADGVIAQAANAVAKAGVPYFSSAGNQERLSYEAAYRETADVGPSGPRHDFDPGPGVDTLQSWVVPSGTFDLLSFQWDAPYLSAGAPGGSDSDLDLYFYDADGNLLPDCSDPTADPCQFPGYAYNIGGDPVEFGLVYNGTGAPIEVQVSVERYTGAGSGPGIPTRVKWVQFALGGDSGAPLEFDTRSSTIFGHANAKWAEAVGAASWYNTKEWGNLLFGDACGYACLTGYSSAGGTPVMFDGAGNRLRRPEYRVKPGVTGPDGGNTTFFFFDIGFPVDGEPDGWPNFFGTSASAPHVAGIAALMLDASGMRLDPPGLYRVLRATAADMTVRRIPGVGFEPLKKGFDYDSGFGFVDATKAVCAARWFHPQWRLQWHDRRNCK
jgi:hypothetical protein